MSKEKEITIEDLARMVAKGFQEASSETNSLRSEMNKRFEKLEDILERMDREMVKKYDFEHILSKYDGRVIKIEEHLSLK